MDVLHGVRVPDPYRWLEDGKSLPVVAWTEAQNAWTHARLDGLSSRVSIRAGLEKLLSIGSLNELTPRLTRAGRWRYFYKKRSGMQNQPVLIAREGLDGPDREVLDVNQLARDGTVALDWFYPSPDGSLVAYGVSRNGDEDSELRVRDLRGAVPKDRDEVISNTRHCSLAWKPDGSGFFYTRYPKKGDVPDGEEKYHRGVFEHRLGAGADADRKLFGDGRNLTDSPAVELSPNGRWLVMEVHQGWAKNELHLIDTNDPTRKLTPIVEGVEANYYATALDDRLVVQTNEGTPRGRIMTIDPRHPQRSRWKEIVGQGRDAIDGFEVAGGTVVVHYLHDAASRLERFALGGKALGEIALPVFGSAELSASRKGNELWILLTSFVVPGDLYHVDLTGPQAGKLQLWQRVQSPLAAENYVVEQQRARSKDGTEVPYFVVRRRDTPQDGTRPALLTGYGGFNISVEPKFVSAAGVLLEAGGVYVQAILRGGGEYGEAWHKAGMLDRKQNVFDDLSAVATDVIDKRIGAAGRLGVIGASNGGLLAAALVVQRPDLFRVAVPRVPLTDLLRYQNFLLAKFWIPEYGSSEDPAMFPALLAESPYHNVREGVRYPAVLLTSGESDGRVDPMHARKMAAALQHATSSDAPILLRMETKAGHGAGKPISKQIDEFTDIYAFILSELGMQASPLSPAEPN